MPETTTTAKTPHFLAPCHTSAFFDTHWERTRLVVKRGDPGYFRDVLGLAELDRLVTSVRIPVTNLNLAQGDHPLPFSAYTTDGSYVDKAAVVALHQQGATVILRSLDQWSPGLTRLRVSAEELFGCESQVNVYLTPPAEKSTPPHWDTHDLFVLQIEGSKRWRLFNGARSLPLGDERFRVGTDVVHDEVEEVVLDAGDTLYLPRGVIHEPVAESYSVHVSLGIHTVRQFDLVSVALRLLAGREGHRLRHSVGHWSDASASLTADVLSDLLSPELLEEARAILQQQMFDRRAIDLEGRVHEIARGTHLDPSASYVRRGGVDLTVTEQAEALHLSAGPQRISVPAALKGAVADIAGRPAARPFSARELTGTHTSEQGLALCAALHEIGAIRTVSHNDDIR